MAENTLRAKRFAQAVFEIAREQNTLDTWDKDLKSLTALAHNPDFVAVMENPRFGFQNKVKLLKTQITDVSPLSFNLAYILVEQGNFSLIAPVYKEYSALLDDFRGIARAEVTTAVPLDEVEKRNLAARLGSITGKKIIISEKVDPEIIGGMIARVGGKIIDGSTRSQLAALKNELINAGR